MPSHEGGLQRQLSHEFERNSVSYGHIRQGQFKGEGCECRRRDFHKRYESHARCADQLQGNSRRLTPKPFQEIGIYLSDYIQSDCERSGRDARENSNDPLTLIQIDATRFGRGMHELITTAEGQPGAAFVSAMPDITGNSVSRSSRRNE